MMKTADPAPAESTDILIDDAQHPDQDTISGFAAPADLGPLKSHTIGPPGILGLGGVPGGYPSATVWFDNVAVNALYVPGTILLPAGSRRKKHTKTRT